MGFSFLEVQELHFLFIKPVSKLFSILDTYTNFDEILFQRKKKPIGANQVQVTKEEAGIRPKIRKIVDNLAIILWKRC